MIRHPLPATFSTSKPSATPPPYPPLKGGGVSGGRKGPEPDQNSATFRHLSATLETQVADGGNASPSPDAERARQLIELRAKSPMRGKADQHDASALDLFRTANEPRLL